MVTSIRSLGFQYSHTIGRHDNAGESFKRPVAMARGNEDRLYVVSRGADNQPTSRRVTVCTVAEEIILEFGLGVSTLEEAEASVARGPLIWPTSIALDKEGNVYLADEWLNWISIFDAEGQFLGKWGRMGTGDGEFDRPSGIAFDQQDRLYLVDSGNNRIQKFTKEGEFLGTWGGPGKGDGEFNLPWGIDLDQQGNVYVADWRNDRIQKFTPDGQFLKKFGSPGNLEGEFRRPTGVAVDKDGTIYVTDWGNERLEVFDSAGSFVIQITGDATISKWGKNKLDANKDMWQWREMAHDLGREKLFSGPIAVEVDDTGRIFVAETGRSRVQVYRKQPPIFNGFRL